MVRVSPPANPASARSFLAPSTSVLRNSNPSAPGNPFGIGDACSDPFPSSSVSIKPW